MKIWETQLQASSQVRQNLHKDGSHQRLHQRRLKGPKEVARKEKVS